MNQIYSDSEVNICFLRSQTSDWLEIRDNQGQLVDLVGAKGFSRYNPFDRLAEFFLTKVTKDWVQVKQLGTNNTDLLLNTHTLSKRLGIAPAAVREANKKGELIRLIKEKISTPVVFVPTKEKSIDPHEKIEVINPQVSKLYSTVFSHFKDKIRVIIGVHYNIASKGFCIPDQEKDLLQDKNLVFFPAAEVARDQEKKKIYITLGDKMTSSRPLSDSEKTQIIKEALEELQQLPP